LFGDNFGMDIGTPYRRRVAISDVMVSFNVKKGDFIKCPEICKVFGREVTACKNEIRRGGESVSSFEEGLLYII